MESIGLLQKYWHAIALSRELKPGRALKRCLYGRPLLVWRDARGVLHAVDDCCAHRRAPLEVRDFQANRIVCPYHGWQYDQTGQLCHVPSDPEAAGRIQCRIPSYCVLDQLGFVWLYPKSEAWPEESAANLNDFLDMDDMAHWPAIYKQKEFATTEELLIDNFMDPTHTAVVHDGVIRSSQQLTEHEMTVTTHDRGISVEFAEREEQVGVGLRYMFGRSMRVQHTDEFLLPNLVRVVYTINNRKCFVALIACTPVGPLAAGRTLALVQLRTNFGWPTRLIQPVISWLANKVLRQDYQITSQQFANLSAFPDSDERKIAADTVAVRIARLREQLIQGDANITPTRQSITLRF